MADARLARAFVCPMPLRHAKKVLDSSFALCKDSSFTRLPWATLEKTDGETREFELKIEKGIPIPRREMPRMRRNNSVRHAVRRLSVGESFFTDKKAAAHKAVYEVAAVTEALFVTRTVEGGTRVWRIK